MSTLAYIVLSYKWVIDGFDLQAHDMHKGVCELAGEALDSLYSPKIIKRNNEHYD